MFLQGRLQYDHALPLPSINLPDAKGEIYIPGDSNDGRLH